MDNTLWMKKWEVIKQMSNDHAPETECNYHAFWHYTSFSVLFSILGGDEFWASNVRFSNDEMEERMMELDDLERRDDYIICFCAKDDMLSQWRGYCHNGGAAIKLYLNYDQKYSVLHSDFDTSGRYEVYENTPLPVVYLKPEVSPESRRKQVERAIAKKAYSNDIKVEDMLPYMKNWYFSEEKELRMVFSNINGSLSKCIRFRTLPDGVKVPYIVVRHGIVGKMKGNCSTDLAQLDDDYLRNLMEDNMPVWIEEGADQEAKYYEAVERAEAFNKRENPANPIRVFCRGKLPVEEITVAPTYDRERKVEQIKRFCMSKYWLKNVKVKASKIPYIQPVL